MCYTPGNVTIDIIINYKYSEIKVIFIHCYSGLWPSNLHLRVYLHGSTFIVTDVFNMYHDDIV